MLVSLLVALAGVAGFQAPTGAIELRAAWTAPADLGADAKVYLTIANTGPIPFAVLETTSVLADSIIASGLGAQGPNGVAMRSAFAVMPQKVLTMVPDGKYLVLKNLKRRLRTGEVFTVTLRCVGDLQIAVQVSVRPSVAALQAGKVS